MLIIPEKDNGEKATSVSYEVAGQPSKNCYNLAKYDGSKHTSTEEKYYRTFRYDDWGGRRCHFLLTVFSHFCPRPARKEMNVPNSS